MERKEILKAAGIDTSKFFSMDVPEGATIIIATPDGKQHVYDKNGNCIDAVLNKINDIGYIKEDPHFRRWIMAQTFDILNSGKSVEKYIDWYKGGYMYQFEVVSNELKALQKLRGEKYDERKQFFTKDVIINLCLEYMRHLKAYVENRPIRNHKGRPYINLPGFGKGVHIKDIEGMVYAPLERALDMMQEAWCVSDYRFIRGFEEFHKNVIKKVTYDKPLNKKWLDAYKGEGAYYTMMGLIKFHNCFVYHHATKYYGGRGEKTCSYNREDSIKAVKDKAYELDRGRYHYWNNMDTEWYKLYGMMKEMIADNNFDFKAKMAEKYGR